MHRGSVGGVGVVGGGGGVRHRPCGTGPHVACHRSRRRGGAGGTARPVGDAGGSILGGLVCLVGRLSPGSEHTSVHTQCSLMFCTAMSVQGLHRLPEVQSNDNKTGDMRAPRQKRNSPDPNNPGETTEAG